MPVYLCKPGWNAEEPWRHGVQVYASPFPMTDEDETPKGGVIIRRVRHSEVVLVDQVIIMYNRYWLRLQWPGSRGGMAGYIALGTIRTTPTNKNNRNTDNNNHEEIHPNALSSLSLSQPPGSHTTRRMNSNDIISPPIELAVLEENAISRPSSPAVTDAEELSPMVEDDDVLFQSSPSELRLRCEETGLEYPCSDAMELLRDYHDGLHLQITASDHDTNEDTITSSTNTHKQNNNNSSNSSAEILRNNSADHEREPVFCRICREGLHDVNYDKTENENDLASATTQTTNIKATGRDLPETTENNHTNNNDHNNTFHDQRNSLAMTCKVIKNHPYRENPLLAPCQCTGSMRFVHYLCVEQWRCRSRHPAARNGLNCETCKTPYTLPPPPSRPQDDAHSWEAMPPHVLAALRRPHLTWQIMAAIVRRKWLRPLAPILISPLVALYCRARRLLKKRGVSRRRWACSLCRRRARWKCVRCLRSYYCSRQCQNVSWHIVHKHVCYKPTRFWWSVAVYGIGTVTAFPGILKDPILYDLGIFSILLSFTISGIIGGGMAQCLKKINGQDIRGRSLEAAVVISTLFLAHITWGLTWAFFGKPQSCTGITTNRNPFFNTHTTATSSHSTHTNTNNGIHLSTLHSMCFRPAKVLISMMDRMILSFVGPTIAPYVCNINNDDNNRDIATTAGSSTIITTCLRMAKNANPDFWMEYQNCRSDLNFLTVIYTIAFVILLSGHWIKQRERQQRRAAAPPALRNIHHPRPHQD